MLIVNNAMDNANETELKTNFVTFINAKPPFI